MKELRLMLRETDPDVSITVKKLALVTLTEVFKDIIPGYRIRELSDTEKLQSVSTIIFTLQFILIKSFLSF